MNLYDKRDDFNFYIMNFPLFLAAPEYGVYVLQLIRYSRPCRSFHGCFYRVLLLTGKLLNQWFLVAQSKSSVVCNKSNRTSTTSGEGTDIPAGEGLEVTPIGVRVLRFLFLFLVVSSVINGIGVALTLVICEVLCEFRDVSVIGRMVA